MPDLMTRLTQARQSCTTALFCLALTLSCIGKALSDDWPVARGNAASTAIASGSLPNKPEVLWEYKTNDDKAGFEGTPVISDGRVFLGDFEGNVQAIDLQSGTLIWKKKFKDGFVTAAAVHDGHVIIGDYSGQVFCLSATDGEQIWTREIDQQIASGPSFIGSNVLLSVENGTMVALDLKTGEQKWTYATGDQLRSSATIWNKVCLLGGCDGRLHKIDLIKGDASGNSIPLDAPTLSTPSVIGNVAIVPTQPGVVLAIDLETDKVLWSFSNQEIATDIRSSPATLGSFEDGKLQGITVVTTRNRRVLGLDLKDGSVLWEAVLRKRTDSSPVICDGRAWVGSADGMLYAIDLKNGEEKWTYQLSGQILAAPAIADGKLVIATEKGTVVCFGSKPSKGD